MSSRLLINTGILFLLLGIGTIPFIPLSQGDADATFDLVRGALSGLGLGLLTLGWMKRNKE
jgi:hypothetical protein